MYKGMMMYKGYEMIYYHDDSLTPGITSYHGKSDVNGEVLICIGTTPTELYNNFVDRIDIHISKLHHDFMDCVDNPISNQTISNKKKKRQSGHDSLGDRMKSYENIERRYLTRRMPTLIRLDGKSFHKFTEGFQTPFDMVLMRSMWQATQYLCANIQGCKIGYTQSDEITLLLTDYDTIATQSWFEKNVQKMCSISASMVTLAFNNAFVQNVEQLKHDIDTDYGHDPELCLKLSKNLDIYYKKKNTALFDSRVYNIPTDEVVNAFIWRQKDATRNAIQMVGRANFSDSQLYKKGCNQIQEMLFQEKNINFNDLPVYQKRGACITKETYMKDKSQRSRWIVDENIPIFTKDRDYINKYIWNL